MEQEFYKASMVGYYPMWPVPVVNIAGTLTVTDQKIHYKPIAMYFIYSPIHLDYCEIAKAEVTSILGMRTGMRITTKKGKEFMFLPPHKVDAEALTDLINQHVIN